MANIRRFDRSMVSKAFAKARKAAARMAGRDLVQPGGADELRPARLENLEHRRLLAADTVQSLPYRLDFNTDRGELLDKDGQGTGFTRVQQNKNGTGYQPSLIDLDTATGTLEVTTTGSSSTGSNVNDDNTLTNALETQFDATTRGWTISGKIVGGLAVFNDRYEQGGLFFGPDQDNFIKLVAIHAYDGPRLQFVDELSDGNGGFYSTAGNLTSQQYVGNWENFQTLELRLTGDAVTGVVTAEYRIDNGQWQRTSHDITIPPEKRDAFFSEEARAGILQFHKNNNGPITVSWDYFQITGGAPVTAEQPTVTRMRPGSGTVDVARDASIAVDVNLPNGAIDKSTATSTNVKLYRTVDGSIIPATVNTTGGGDALVLKPLVTLDANTNYTFEITGGVKDITGVGFVPFTGTFTTGTSLGESDPSVSFDKIALPTADGYEWTGLTVGPDGKLYGTTLDGLIVQFGINTDGTLTGGNVIETIRTMNGGKRAITGLVFDPNSTAENLIAYVTHSQWIDFKDYSANSEDWTGKITRLTGANLQTGMDVIVGLPRSRYDHMTNQAVFGPDGRLYFNQGANSAMGAPDSTWANRPERLMTAATLVADVRNITTTVNVRTPEGGGTYNPFAPDAPVKIYATGVRNAYDLVWHSNGHLYVAANGSAAGGNTPASPGTTDPEFGDDRLDLDINGPYTGQPTVPGRSNVDQTMNDFLFDVVAGGYYGHPNSLRDEWVLNGGNPTSGTDPGEVTAYPVGTQPDRNYRGFAYDFGQNKSANGIIEFKGQAFDGALDGKLLVVRYSGGDDILILTPDADGNIIDAQSGFAGLSGFNDPLDLTQDPSTGFLYVAEHGSGTIKLLKPITPGAKATVTTGDKTVDKPLVFSDVATGYSGGSGAGSKYTITIHNTGISRLAFPADGLEIVGGDASQFKFLDRPATLDALEPGESLSFTIAFEAASKGIKTAELRIKSNDPDNPTQTIALRGLGSTGLGGADEPSLQRILDLYQIPVSVGDPDAETTDYPSSNTVSGSDEILAQRFVKSGTEPVTIEVLGIFSGQNRPLSARMGFYEPGTPNNYTELFTVNPSSGQTVTPTINAKVTTLDGRLVFDPQGAFALMGIFPDFNNRQVYGEDSLNTWEGNSSERRKVRVFPLKTTDGTIVPQAYIFTMEEWDQASDQNDIVGIIRNVDIAAAGPEIGLANKDGVPFPDRLVFNRISSDGLDPDYANTVHERVTFTVRNTGSSALSLTNLQLSSGDWVIESGGGNATIQPGQSRDITLRFVYDRDGTGIELRQGTLTFQTNDADESQVSIQLAGLWQSDSEYDRYGNGQSTEPNLDEIIRAFGYSTNVGPAGGHGDNTGQNTAGKLIKVGEETLSGLWQQADPSKPVGVRMLAAYHQQKQISASSFGYYREGSSNFTWLFQHEPRDGQSVLPRNANVTFSPGTGAFGIWIDGKYSEASRNTNSIDPGHAMRFFPARDREGNLIPDTYILAHDYVGVSYSNYDYQDNVYILTNVRPVSGPSAPASVTASATTSGIRLNWGANTEGNVAGYNIYRSSSANGTFTKINAQPVTQLSFNDILAPTNQQSYYRVVAVDYHGTESAASTASAFRAGDTVAPGAPRGLTTSANTGGITLNWTANTESDLRGYNVYRANSADGTFTKLNTSPLTGISFLDSTAPAGQPSYYRLTAVDMTGNESAAATASAMRPADTGAVPATPTNLNITAVAPGSISLAWTDVSTNESGFRVYRASHGGGFTLIATLAADATSYTDPTTIPDTPYAYRVAAFNTAGESEWSNQVNPYTPANPVAVPSGLSATATGPNSVSLMWTDNAGDETGYRVERRTIGGVWQQVGDDLAANATSFTDGTVQASTGYEYRVRAVRGTSTSEASGVASVTTPASSTLARPTNLAGTAVTPTQVNLSWSDNATNETGYLVQRRLSGGTWATVKTLGANVTSWADNTVSANTAYEYRVAATSSSTQSDWSNVVTLSTPVADGFVSTDFGDAVAGSTTVVTPGRDYNVSGGGSDIWFQNDSFRYVHRQITGDFDLMVTVANFDSADPGSQAGLMAREVLTTNSKFVNQRLGGGEARLNYRESTNGYANGINRINTSAPVTLRLKREGSTFTGYYSTNGGATWTTVGQINVAMSQTIYIGMAVTARTSSGALATAQFRNFQEVAPVAAAPAAPTGLSAAPASSSVALSWTDNATTETGYVVERRTAGGAWAAIANLAAGATGFTDGTVAAGTSYEYRVGARNDVGTSYSSTVSATVPAQVILAAPTSTSATATGPTSVTVTWNDTSTSETGHQIQRRTAGGVWQTITTVNAGITQFNDTSLSASTSYEYRVRAVNGAETGAFGPIATVTTSAAPTSSLTSSDIGGPVPAGSTTIVTPGRDYDIFSGGRDVWGTSDQLHLAWQQISGDFDIKVQITQFTGDDGGAMAGLMARSSLDAGSQHAFIRRSPGHEYRLNYRTNNNGGSGGAGRLSGPTGGWVRLTRVGNTFTGYMSSDGQNWTSVGTVNITAGQTMHVGLAVSARSFAGGSASAKFRNLEGMPGGITPAPTAPAAPSTLTATPADGVISLAWQDNSQDETSFLVQRRAAGTSSWSQIAFVAANVTTFTDVAVTPGSSYEYRILAANDVGSSSPSNVVTATVAQSLPAAPTGLSTLDTTSSSATLAWNHASGNETGFELQRRIGSGVWQTIATLPADSTEHTDTGLSASTSYEYRLRAINSAGESAWSNTTVATTSAASVSSLTGSDIGATGGSTTQVGTDDFDILGIGQDAWGRSDQMHFAHEQVTGDFDLVVRVASLRWEDPGAMAGLMVRQSLDPTSRNVFMRATKDAARMNTRSSDGGGTSGQSNIPVNYSTGVYLRLQRTGNTFTGYVSSDGQNWTTVGVSNVAMSQTVYVGLGVTARSFSGGTATAQFRDYGPRA